jgi:SAM-dependent methyltransferase
MDYIVGKSKFWELLWKYYSNAPSIVLCRVPELEYASQLQIRNAFLDHCCGDGIFSSLAWPGKKFAAGCDINQYLIETARSRGIYSRLDVCDASKKLPYESHSFSLIFNNSALEHILDLDAAIKEIVRILASEGIFAFNVLNHRYFEWWPLDDTTKNGYRKWQPFYHALSLEEWSRRLSNAGLKIVSVEGYFDQKTSCELAFLDYYFSGYYIAHMKNIHVLWYRYLPIIPKIYWKHRLSVLNWKIDPDSGSGYFIQAVHA